MSIIERILYTLKERGLSMADLSRFLKINTSTISNWKLYNRNPPAEYIIPICEFLGVSSHYLLTGENESPYVANGYVAENIDSYTSTKQAKKIEVIPDPELKRMIDILTEIMSDPDPRRRAWATIQFEDAFRSYCTLHDEKKMWA